jgi:hypothetical protein
MTYYEQIGLSPSASPEAIDSALLDLGLDWRDRQRYSRTQAERLEAERMLQAIAQIRFTLLDPARRAAYDQAIAPAPVLQRREAAPSETLFRPTTIRVSMTPEPVETPPEPQAVVPPEPVTRPLPTAVRPVRAQKRSNSGLKAALILGGLAAFVGALIWGSGAFKSPVRDLTPAPAPPVEVDREVQRPAAAPLEPPVDIAPPEPVREAPREAVAPVTSGYETITDSAGGYAIAVPASLTERAQTQNGQRFATPDGRVQLLTESVPAPMSIANAYRQAVAVPGREVTYKASGGSWYVVSGYEGQTLFYEKTVWSDGRFKSFRFTVPRALRSTYYTPIEHVANSFKTSL